MCWVSQAQGVQLHKPLFLGKPGLRKPKHPFLVRLFVSLEFSMFILAALKDGSDVVTAAALWHPGTLLSLQGCSPMVVEPQSTAENSSQQKPTTNDLSLSHRKIF